MKITFPTCEFCGADDPRTCPSCGRFSCFECYIPVSGSFDEYDCMHEPFEPIVGDNWKWEWSTKRATERKERGKYGVREGFQGTVQGRD